MDLKTEEKRLVSLLRIRNRRITTAESCTGGLVSSLIVNVPGASECLDMAFVTYSEESKIRLLGVKPETLEKYTVVSTETAVEMAEGAKRIAGSDLALSVTGYAGPGGGTETNPTGTVCIACAGREKTQVKRYHFEGGRFEVRMQAAKAAIEMAIKAMEEG